MTWIAFGLLAFVLPVAAGYGQLAGRYASLPVLTISGDTCYYRPDGGQLRDSRRASTLVARS